MSVRYRFPIRLAALLIIASAMLSACAAIQPVATPPAITAASSAAQPSASASAGSAPSASTATGAPSASAEADASSTNLDERAVMAGIQETLDLYAQAYNESDAELLTQTIDQANVPFRRLVLNRFQTAQESVLGAGGGYEYEVKRVKPRDHGLVEAHIEIFDSACDWTFREVEGRWLLSEPTQKQIGEREETETEHFTFYTYAWTDELEPAIIKLMDEAHAWVEERLGKTPEKKADVHIVPIFGGNRVNSAQTLAYYDTPTRRTAPDRMVIFAPGSYMFGCYDAEVGWEAELRATLVHEYTHLVNNRSFTPIHRMSDWMYEGLAEYVSDSPRAGEVSRAVRSGNIIPIIDPSDRVNKQDLQHLYILERDVSLAYGLSYSLVAFIVDQYGGLDGFWKLVQVYDRKQNLPESLQEAFGVSYEQFDGEWRAWLKQNY